MKREARRKVELIFLVTSTGHGCVQSPDTAQDTVIVRWSQKKDDIFCAADFSFNEE